ncbi:hypothetical protein Tco_0451681 [Tanacetum coccineum]
MVISSPCLTDTKNWLVQSKRLWVINAPCYCNKALTSPVQTTTGKDTSNPLMAGLEAKVSSVYNKITKQMIIKIKNAVKKRLDTILKSLIKRNLKLTSEVQV